MSKCYLDKFYLVISVFFCTFVTKKLRYKHLILKAMATKKVTIKVTPDEYSILLDILSSVKEIMEWDEGMQEYTDHDNFVYCMSKEEYETLQKMNI